MTTQELAEVLKPQTQETEKERQAKFDEIWKRIPEDKRVLYQSAFAVIGAANSAFPEPHEELATEKAIAMYKAGHAYRLVAAVDSMSRWAGSTRSRTVYVVQTISDWLVRSGWDGLRKPLRDSLIEAYRLGRACGWNFGEQQQKAS